jgi:hypothetical protein
MTVRSDKSNIFVVAVAFVCGAIVPVMLLRDGLLAVGWGLLIADLVYCARWTVSVFHTLSFTQAGITVTFWRWKKEIPWNEVTVRVENYENSLLNGRNSCKESVVFSTKRTHKPAIIQPLSYSAFFTSLFICVCGCPGISDLSSGQAGIFGNTVPVWR